MKKLVLILLLGVIALLNASEKWTYVNGLDDFTDEKVQRVTYEDNGHKFQIVNINNELWFFITRKKLGKPYKIKRHLSDGTLYPSTKIVMRVDKDVLHSYDLGKEIKSALWTDKKESKYVTLNSNLIAFQKLNFLISGKHSDENISMFDNKTFLTCELFKGNYLKIKYDTEYIEPEAFKIPLKGFKSAFTNAFDKDLIPDCK